MGKNFEKLRNKGPPNKQKGKKTNQKNETKTNKERIDK